MPLFELMMMLKKMLINSETRIFIRSRLRVCVCFFCVWFGGQGKHDYDVRKAMLREKEDEKATL